MLYSVVVNVSVTNASASAAHLQHVEFFSHCRLGALVLQLNLFDGSLQGINHLPNPSVVITPVELPMFGFCQTSVGKILSVRVAINFSKRSQSHWTKLKQDKDNSYNSYNSCNIMKTIIYCHFMPVQSPEGRAVTAAKAGSATFWQAMISS